MTLRILARAALLGSAALFAIGCAHGDGHDRSTGEVIDDSAITAKVKSALLREKDVKSFDIEVQTFNGVVQLSGFVDSEWQVEKAEQVASSVAGVQKVQNNLVHKSK